MKSMTVIILWFLITFSLSLVVGIHIVSAQDDTLTDSDSLVYYSNPSAYIDKKVNLTGKILSLLPPSSGTLGLQMYQAGDTNRNTIVVYSTPMQFSTNECVRVIGVTQPITEYQNIFGARLSAAAIEAESIKKIECSESIEPAIKTIFVNQTQEKNVINITLDKVEFSEKNTRVYLTVENTGGSDDVSFFTFNSRAIQDKTQFTTTQSYDVDYPNIESTIPPGVIERGVVLFEPMDLNGSDVKFRFEFGGPSYTPIQFIFDVIISPVEYYNNLLSTANDTETLFTIGGSLFDLGNYKEAITAYDKILFLDPNDTYALNNKGSALLNLENYTGAIEYFDKVLAIDPNDAHALRTKAAALLNLENYTGAIDYYDKALVIDPNDIYSLHGKGLTFYALENDTGAIEYFDKALVIDPNDIDALNGKGTSLYNLGNYTGAIEYFDKVLAIDPNNSLASESKQDAVTMARMVMPYG
jgi:Flp pilus assembly protein TadD